MKLDSLKIEQSPKAFAPLAEKHNALVQLIAGIKGQGGIVVLVADGGILIRGGGVGSSATSGDANVGRDLYVERDAFIGRDAYVHQNLFVVGNVTIDGTVTIDGKTLGVKTFIGCDSGVPKYYDVLATDFRDDP